MRALLFALALCVFLLPTNAWAQSSCGQAYEAGQEARASGDLKRARSEFEVCAQAECPDFVVQDCTKWLVEVGESIPKITIKVLDEEGVDILSPKITLDGEKFDSIGAVEVNPGEHQIEVEVEGRVSMTKRINLAAGEKRRVLTFRPEKLTEEEPEAPPTPASNPPPIGFYVASTTSVVALGTFAALAISGTQKETSLRDSGCADEPEGCEVGGLKTQYLAADISLGVGVLSAGIATYLFLTKDKGQQERPAAWNVDIGPTQGGAAATLRGWF